MGDIDIDNLLKALSNENNETVLELDHKKVSKIKNDILQKLHLPKEKLKKFHKSLKFYRFVDELPELRYGSFIRWISLKNPEKIYLTNGGIVCEIKIGDDGIIIVCKNNRNRMFQLKMAENLIFQKLTQQEQVLLSAMDYLNS